MSELYTYDDDTDFDDVFGDLNLTMLHSDEKHHVFVYGTLMSGMRNNHRMMSLDAKLIASTATLEGDYAMRPRRTGLNYLAPIVYSNAPGEPQGKIRGEVYEVDSESLMTLDLFEGHPDVYRREQHAVMYATERHFTVKNAWVYIFVDTEYCDTKLHNNDYLSVSRNRGSSFVVYQWRGEKV